MEIADSTFIVTGAARGIGRQTVLDLVELGAYVAAFDIRGDELATLAQAQVRVFTVDVTDELVVEQSVAQVLQVYGTCNGLVHCAGIIRDAPLISLRPGGLTKMSLRDWQRVLDVNLTGTFLCVRETAMAMIQSKSRGVVVLMSSVSRAGNPGQSNYAVTKAGISALVTTWSQELSPFGIRVAGIAPGLIDTPMVEDIPEHVRDQLKRRILSRRLGRASEISATVRFIIENDYVNGRVLEIDGGLRF